MKFKLIVIFLTFSIKGFSTELDTLDYWLVYKNDKIIAKFNSASKDLNIKLSKANIKKLDTISLQYVSCNRCYKCTYILFVSDEKSRKLRYVESKQESGKLSLGLLDLIEFGKKNKSKIYNFYYKQRNNDMEYYYMKLVLKVRLD